MDCLDLDCLTERVLFFLGMVLFVVTVAIWGFDRWWWWDHGGGTMVWVWVVLGIFLWLLDSGFFLCSLCWVWFMLTTDNGVQGGWFCWRI